METEFGHRLTTSDGKHTVLLPVELFKHCTYARNIIELDPAQSASFVLGCHLDDTDGITYPIDEGQLNCIVEFLKRHNDDKDPMSPEEMNKFKELDEWETAILSQFTGLRALGLAQAAEYLGHNAIVRTFARRVAAIMESMTEKELLNHFNLPDIPFSDQELEAAKKTVPEAFE